MNLVQEVIKRLRCALGFHDWGKWQLYYRDMGWQRRSCRIGCGSTEVRDHPKNNKAGSWL